MKTVKFYVLGCQPIILMPDKKGKHKGQINIMQIFNMGCADWQLTPGGNPICSLARRVQCRGKQELQKP
jgi:hypothetical protein